MTARTQRRILNEVKKNPGVSAKNVQKSLEHAYISVDESTMHKTLNMNGVHGKTPQRKPLLSKQNIATLQVCKSAPRCSKAVLAKYSVETTVELLGKDHNTVWRKKGSAHQHQKLISTVKYGGGSIIVWGCFAVLGPGQLATIDGKRNSQVYQDIF